MSNWTFNALDQQTANDLQSHLPSMIFDAHAHLWRKKDMPKSITGLWAEGPDETGANAWRHHVGQQVGAERLVGGLLFPAPFADGNIIDENTYLFEQIAGDPMLKGLALIAPQQSPEYFRSMLANPQFAGFKPYHVFSDSKPTFEAPISTYVPPWAWAMAHEHGLAITLHLVRYAALADPVNQRELRHYCIQYPKAKLILAHAGRGFHAPNTVKGIAGLRGLENVWFDTSAICESTAFEAILNEFGPRRLLWGSDFPITEIRGRYVTVGDGFAGLQPDTFPWEKISALGKPILLGLESLRALKTATDAMGLNAADLQDIYANNAMRLFGLKTESGTQTQELYRRAKQRIPGGTQLLSKRPEIFAPNQWPAYFREARGCEVIDLDGRRYLDVATHGIGACLLGYRDPDVTHAVQRQLSLGSFSTLNSPDEVELADLLCQLHPWAKQVRLGRSGGEMMAVAVRIARATTDRSRVAVCGYHGWHDWYLAANLGQSDALRGHLLPGLAPLGVPRELRGTAFPFKMNDRAALQEIMDKHGDQLAAVVMEPCRYRDPDPGFLQFVHQAARKVGALLIFDEITIGWRLTCGGAHLRLGVTPDMAVFAKALGNGHPMAAVIGTSDAMTGAHDSFISSTYWTEGIGPAAALATIRKMQQVDLPSHCVKIGQQVQEAWRSLAKKHGLPIEVPECYPALAQFSFKHQLAPELKTLYIQEMLQRGFLATTSLYVTLAHTQEVAEKYTIAIDFVFEQLAEALAQNQVAARLRGPVAHQTFGRLL